MSKRTEVLAILACCLGGLALVLAGCVVAGAALTMLPPSYGFCVALLSSDE